jgi:hypothetical protein
MSNSFEWVSISSCSWFPLLFSCSVDLISLFHLFYVRLHLTTLSHRHCLPHVDAAPARWLVPVGRLLLSNSPSRSQGHKWVIGWGNVDVGLPRHTSLRLGSSANLAPGTIDIVVFKKKNLQLNCIICSLFATSPYPVGYSLIIWTWINGFWHSDALTYLL